MPVAVVKEVSVNGTDLVVPVPPPPVVQVVLRVPRLQGHVIAATVRTFAEPGCPHITVVQAGVLVVGKPETFAVVLGDVEIAVVVLVLPTAHRSAGATVFRSGTCR